ncbi:hypothetical protein [Amycolatopsis sp. CA-230715]|uniref:hypothetical protein n=1 Tax=Amycolatopsis sp. CA-230715 TaxID=2745196 RepID=UPI001C01D0E0|nr:hypothetical protein [Amycolatopsis sp. CA-230715]QWF85758.1 hypothetical protein HUW46_09238 [Amycolatopsis sp. CA-230715]
METLDEHIARRHAESVARGEHDDQCEVLATLGFYLCHCSKRRREARGYTEPPGDLDFPPPVCPRCLVAVDHDGDGWECRVCDVTWDSDGTGASFCDDYGDLGAALSAHRHAVDPLT